MGEARQTDTPGQLQPPGVQVLQPGLVLAGQIRICGQLSVERADRAVSLFELDE
jgi:hypothetical protein